MRITSVWRALFPPARKRVTLRALAPLLGWLLVFSAIVIGCEWRRVLRFNRPESFWLVAFAPWIWWLHHAGAAALGKGRALAALLIRLLVVGVFILTLAEPRAVRRSDALSLVYALDISDSMGGKVSDQALAWVQQTAAQKPPKDEAGLVVFGGDAAVELPPRTTFPFEAINSRVTRDGSNLAKALGLAAATLPEQNQGRIVLLSDGNETEGNVSARLDELKARGVAVDVLPVNFDFQKEVWLERLDLPRVVKVGETYEASVILNSLTKGSGKLVLSENGKPIFEKPVTYEAGKTRFTLPLYLREPGFYEYAATIQLPPGEDSWAENNVAIGDLFLRGEGQVLVVTDPKADVRDWEPLVEALKAAQRVVKVQMAYEFPRDALSLQPYDLIVFPNVPADAFDAVQLQAARDAVFNNGTGFLMLGGPQSFGPGGYQHTAIEEVLPVDTDVTQRKVMPSGSLLIVLDCSGSMGMQVAGRTKISLADRGAILALQTLTAQDQFGVFAVDTEAHKVVPLGAHGVLDGETSSKVLSIGVGGGGIYIYESLKEALQAFKGVETNLKHVILFSDAADAEQKEVVGSTALDLAARMTAEKITLSVVALGRENDQDTAFLHQLALQGGGRFYLTEDATTLPQIFTKEALTLKRTMLQNRVFVPEVQLPSPVLKGIDALPNLRGYVLTTAKPRATTILRTPETKEEPGEHDPLLTTWRFGLGVSAAWTSDLGPAWAKDWIGWDKYRAFVKQLAIDLSRVETKNDLRLSTFAADGSGSITVEDFAKDDAFLRVEARVSGPNGQSLAVPLQQIGPRRYQGSFPLSGKGRYQVIAAAAGRPGATEPEKVMGGFVVPYSPEYLHFRSDPRVLEEIARKTGGRVLSASDTDIFHPPRQTRESSAPVIDWFLIVLACLIPIDVGIRRIQLDWSLFRDWFRRGKREESTATMNSLLERKSRGKLLSIPASAVPAALTTELPAPVTPPNPAPADEAASPAEESTSTTGRLLARKKKRENDR